MSKVVQSVLIILTLTVYSFGQTGQLINMETQKDLIEFRVSSLTKHTTGFINGLLNKNDDFILVLEQVDNAAEKIEMIIGKSEAAELGVAIEEHKSARPLPSEVLKTIITEFGFNLSKVIIDDLKDGIFYSKMILTRDNESKAIDCRPADSITQAFKFGCKVYVSRTVIEKNKH
jgi:bifunctional DNase/RNase